MPKATKVRVTTKQPLGNILTNAWFIHKDNGMLFGRMVNEAYPSVWLAQLTDPLGNDDSAFQYVAAHSLPEFTFFKDKSQWLACVAYEMECLEDEDDCCDDPSCDCQADAEPCPCPSCTEDRAEFMKRIERRESATQMPYLEGIVRSTIADDNSKPSAQVELECRAELEAARKAGYPTQ